MFRRREPAPRPVNTTAVVLAGGRSSRFGSDKALAELKGRPLVQWAVQLAAAVSAQTVVALAADADATRIQDLLGAPVDRRREGGLVTVRDAVPAHGPVAGVQAAMQQVHAPYVVLLAVDMPLLRPDLVLGLMDRLVGHDAVAWHLDGWWRPFPSLWRLKPLQAALAQAAKEQDASLHGLLDQVDARPLGREFLALFDAEGAALSSVNTPADLDAVAARLG